MRQLFSPSQRIHPKTVSKKQVYRTELYENLLQVAGTTRLEFLHLLRHLPQVEDAAPVGGEATHPAGIFSPPNDFYTKQIQTGFTPETSRLLRNRNVLPICNCLFYVDIQLISSLSSPFPDISSQNQTLPFGKFFSTFSSMKKTCFSSGNKSNWNRSKEQSTLVTMPRQLQVMHFIPLTRLWLQKKLIKRKKKVHGILTSFRARHVAPPTVPPKDYGMSLTQ